MKHTFPIWSNIYCDCTWNAATAQLGDIEQHDRRWPPAWTDALIQLNSLFAVFFLRKVRGSPKISPLPVRSASSFFAQFCMSSVQTPTRRLTWMRNDNGGEALRKTWTHCIGGYRGASGNNGTSSYRWHLGLHSPSAPVSPNVNVHLCNLDAVSKPMLCRVV